MSGRAYYNEIDAYAAQWLRNLIAAGHIAPGDVDERSIVDVRPDDLRGYTQCHFFAGIGGWSYAARLAGWPDDRALWTGSCPCQPFSVAGAGKGQADERHLWPIFFDLIRACNPTVVMGEQVAAAVGKHWLDGVHSDLEGIGYSFGATVVPACAVDAPHRRDRLWFVADAQRESEGRGRIYGPGEGRCEAGSWAPAQPIGTSLDGTVAHAERSGSHAGPLCGVYRETQGQRARDVEPVRPRATGAVADTERRGQSQQPQFNGGAKAGERPSPWGHDAIGHRVLGADGKARRIEPSIRLLAHGVPARVGKLRAYGNAIVPQVAAEVIGAYLDAERIAA